VRLEWLDALRAVAICMVVAVHTAQWMPVPDSIGPLFIEGARGVQLFFVISGFTMMLSLSRNNAVGPVNWAGFAVRRVFRIVPLFWIAALFWFFLLRGEPHYWSPEGASWLTFVFTIFFLGNWVPWMHSAIVPGGWSIAAEMNMYALMPFLFRTLRCLRTAIIWGCSVFAAAILLSAVGYYIFYGSSKHPELVRAFFNSYWLPVCLPSFIAGIAAFYAVNTIVISKRRALFLLIGATVLFGIVAYTKAPLKSVLVAPIFGTIVWAAASVFKDISIPYLITWCGKTSYSSYFVHFGVLHLLASSHFWWISLESTLLPWLFAQVLVLSITILIASFSFLLIEKPLNRLGAILASRVGRVT
jgi:peptidoglycan/LPS O-acetylase OafA/YrhL